MFRLSICNSARLVASAFAAVLALLSSAPSAAASATATFLVTATVLPACITSVPATLAFGNYTAASALPGTTAFNVTCTSGTSYSLGLSAGSSTGATITTRKMTNGSVAAPNNTLAYGLYRDALHNTNWDNAASGGFTGNGAAQLITVYGLIPAGQYTAAAGDYSDTITLTLTY